MTMTHNSTLRTDIFAHSTAALGWLCVALTLSLLMGLSASARSLYDRERGLPLNSQIRIAAGQPVFQTRLHYVGQVWFAITNYGLFGTENDDRVDPRDIEALKIDYSPSFEFPAGTRNEYVYAGGIWFGGIIGTDTLVSMPINGQSNSRIGELAGYDTIMESSTLRGSRYYSPDARAEQEYYTVYSDTMIIGSTDEVEGRRHKPLHIEVHQTSYAWSDRFSRQFIIVECWIRNIGTRPIEKMACGVFLDADVLNKTSGDPGQGSIDDISGFLEQARSLTDETIFDKMNTAWVADNDGDPVGNAFQSFSPNGAVGIRILRAYPAEKISFNWWVGGGSRFNWGPVRSGARAPQTQGGLGSPQGDRNSYYVMTNGEIDYGQLLSNYDLTQYGWQPPNRSSGCDFANGIDTRQVLSVGPACNALMPGDSVPFVFALCGGRDLHTDASRQFNCREPIPFMNALDYSDLNFAATWASWVYDTPGFDSDHDGYKGQSHRTKTGGQTFYTGDLGPPPGSGPACVDWRGAPDYSGPTAPSCPQPGKDLYLVTKPNEIIVHWTGESSENDVDPLTGVVDFEGYGLYASKVNSTDQYSLISTWDRDNYYPYKWWGNRWVLDGPLMSVDDVHAVYGDDVDPSLYTNASLQTCYRDSIYYNGFHIERQTYFQKSGPNRSNTYWDSGQNLVNPIQHLRDSTIIEGGDTLTFGIYEAHITGLNASDDWYVSVTAFDFGDKSLRLDPMESLPGTCYDFAVPIYSADVVQDSGLHVSVYPNPYLSSFEGRDGKRTTYFDLGYEAPNKRGTLEPLEEQDRRIWFINLPSEATIYIYTLDGDLIRTIEHKWPRPQNSETYLSDYSSRAAWDLITRNTQAVTSGIYLYVIKSPVGTQSGKIVIVK